jgi:membrane-bound serine protease (ClpP class)
VAGAAGVVCALLAAWSLAVLPTNWLALAVLLAGQALFTVDAALGGLGLGTAGAAALTAAGSWWLFSSPSPLLRVDGRLAALGVLWSLAWFVVILTVVLRSQRQAGLGTEALVGSRGVVRSILNPGGIVVVDGGMWRATLATGDGSLGTGQRVTVDAVVDGILQVRPDDPTAVRPTRRRGRRAPSDRGATVEPDRPGHPPGVPRTPPADAPGHPPGVPRTPPAGPPAHPSAANRE